MKKFILGIMIGILIAGSAVYFLRQQQDGGQSAKQNQTNALSKIRKTQQKPQNNPKENLQKFATDLMQAKSPQDMLKAIDEIIKIRPQEANLYALKSQILQQQGNFKGAVEAINKAINLDPQNANYYRIRAEQEFAMQNFPMAERDFTAAAQLSGKADNYYNRAITNLNLGNYAAANQDFKKAQTLYKKEGNLSAANQAQNVSKMLTQNMPKQNTKLPSIKGETAKKSQTENKNTQAINDAITSNISQSLKHFSQSETLKSFQDLFPQGDKALPSFQELLNNQDIKPKITKKDIVQGTALESISKAKQLIAKKDFDGAKQVLDKAIEDFPKDDSLLYNRAQANYAQGNYREAFKDLDKALEINPKNYQAASAKGDMLQSAGQTDQAKKAYQEAAKMAEEKGNTKAAEEAKAKYQLLEGKEITAKTNQRLSEAANAYYKGDFDKAANIFKQIYQDNPTPENAFNLGLAYNSQGKTKEAAQMFAFAADNKPQDLNSQILAAQSSVQLEDFDMAQKYLSQAKKIDDENPDIWALSAQVNSASGNMNETRSDLQHALDGYRQQISESQDDGERAKIEERIQNIQSYLEQLNQAGM